MNSLKQLKKLLHVAMILIVAITSACSTSTTSSSTSPAASIVTYDPAIYYSTVYVTEGDSAASGTSVNYFVRTSETRYTTLVDVIYYYDVTPPTTQGQAAYTASGTYSVQAPAEDSYVWKNVPPGEHTFSAQLVKQTDDTPLNPPVIAQTIVTVPPAGSKDPVIRLATVEMSYPMPSNISDLTPSPLPPLEAQFETTVQNFQLNDDAIGKQNVAGQGHFIYYMDVEPPGGTGQQATTAPGTFQATTDGFHFWKSVSAGRHVFTVQLVNNDNTPLDPPVTTQVIVTIPQSF